MRGPWGARARQAAEVSPEEEQRRATFLTLAEWEGARVRQILRRIAATMELLREHVERQERYLARAREVGSTDANPVE